MVELMLVVGISGVVLLAMMTSVGMMYGMQSQQNLVFTRNEIAARVRITALTPGALENSAIMTKNLGVEGLAPPAGAAPVEFTRHDALMKCHPAFTEPDQTGCDRSELDVAERGNYFYLSERNSTDPSTALAGEFVYYNVNGSRCTQEQAKIANDCPLFARIWAEPFCLNFASACNKAMSFSIRYSVGVRDDYRGAAGRKPTTLEGEITVPLQKGIQITRVLDQDNNPLVPNAKGVYGTQKYYGYPDQAGNPRALRFEVLVGNPTGLKNIRVQMRALTGPSAKSYSDLTVPSALTALDWADVPNPDNTAEAWVISLHNASQNQLFNFGTVNTIKGFVIGARYDLPNEDSLKKDYLYHFSADGVTLLPPRKFKSGVYQFRVVALDTGDNHVESTNYATVRIFSRPQMYLAPSTGIPTNLSRNCLGADSKLNLSVMVGDDEQIVRTSYTITASDGTEVGGGEQAFVSTTGSFPLVFDKAQPAGTYLVRTVAANVSTGTAVRGVPLPATETSTLPASLLLNEVTPIVDLVSNPLKVRVNSTADASFSYTTGNCCTMNPTVDWTFPNVPEIGNVPMLSSSAPNANLTCVQNANGTRSCTSATTVMGLLEGPATAAPNISAELQFTGAVQPACQVMNTATLKYFPVIRIPGIQFFNSESMWLTPPSTGGSMKALDRRVWVKADFPPADEPVTISVQKPGGTPVCPNMTFAAGTGVDPVLRDCAIPSGYSGDLILARVSPNIKTSADVGTSWRAALVEGKLNHRVCSADIGDAGGPFPSNYTIPYTLPMLNSPWGLNADGSQKANNDAGKWNAGASRSLRCWDTWTGFVNSNNKQDGFYALDSSNEGKPFTSQIGTRVTMPFPTFFFPYNGGSSPDFDARNVPYVFAVSRGMPETASYRYAVTGSTSASDSIGNAWTNVTANYCNGAASMSQVQLWMNQLEGFDTATQTMKAANLMSVTQRVGTNFQYVFFCTYGRYSPLGE